MKINKLREGLKRKLRGVEEQKAEVESKRESLMQQIASVEKGKKILSYLLSIIHLLFH